MKKTLLTAALIAFGLTLSIAQIDFQPGHFINNEGVKRQCLIRNAEWALNPTTFKYKLDEKSEVAEADISTVQEFAVGDLHYIRATVEIDQTSRDMKTMGVNRFPEWKTETVFLKELVSGKACLYQYATSNFERFFFSVEKKPIKQLIYKEYLAATNQGGYSTYRNLQQVRINGAYLSQLEKEVSCGTNVARVSPKKFNKTTLTNYFIKYNICSGDTILLAEKSREKTKIHLKVTPGIDQGQLTLANSFGGISTFDKTLNARIGGELEVVIPANRNKWSIMVEPTFQSYMISGRVNYKSIELPIGLRHYFYISKNSRIHLNAGVTIDRPLQYEVKVSTRYVHSTVMRFDGFGGAGFGYKRFSIEARYYSKRTGGSDDALYFMNYHKSSIILGYRIF